MWKILTGIVVATHATAVASAALGQLPLAAALTTALAAPAGRDLVLFVQETRYDPTRSFRSKFFANKWHGVAGLALSLGLVAGRLLLGGGR